jgi:hypothetical protein
VLYSLFRTLSVVYEVMNVHVEGDECPY